MKLEINFSEQTEIARIRYTINEIDWFKERGYRVNFPGGIKELVDQGKVPTDEEISDIVSKEFDEKQYEEKKKELELRFYEKKDQFEKSLATLGLPLQPVYKISLTKYGVGGSYFLPNGVLINFDYPNARRDVSSNTLHEIIHLTIEKLILKYNIEHWSKERLVDLTYREFFPSEDNKPILQRNPKHAEQIHQIFDQLFPDMQTIIVKMSQLEESPSMSRGHQ